jgi:uncharacterized protein YidB (DUF937 family)
MFDRRRMLGLSRQRAGHNLQWRPEPPGTEQTSERCRHPSNLRWSKKMSRGMPSMTALLGLLAIAGYQNRDKLAEMLKGAGATNTTPGSASQQPSLGGLFGNLGGMLGGAGVGGLLNGGIGELLEKFKQSGQGETAQSWVNNGPNQEISPPQLKQAIGPDVLQELEQQTGLSQQEILARLSRELPTAVDKYTPEGRLPGA